MKIAVPVFFMLLLVPFISLHASEVTVAKTDAGAVVKIDGKLFTEYLIKSGNKPICYPVIGPTGKAVTRHYPIAADKGKGEKHDHPHHRSLWFTHGDVNGISYWHEGDNTGTIVHREFVKLENAGSTAVIVSRNDWVGPDGKVPCSDVRTLTFGADKNSRWIDFDVVFTGGQEGCRFGDTKEGSFGVRVAGTMKVDANQGGKVINSEGQTDKGAWGKPAAWVDYFGPVEGEQLGIAILNHPKSFRHPSYWHVRTYGLFTANVFGLRHFTGGKAGKGEHTLKPGEKVAFYHRVVFHKGDDKQAQITKAFAQYAKLEKP
ncbi:MAG: PmoA family protein [Pirellulales bacterium]